MHFSRSDGFCMRMSYHLQSRPVEVLVPGSQTSVHTKIGSWTDLTPKSLRATRSTPVSLMVSGRADLKSRTNGNGAVQLESSAKKQPTPESGVPAI